MFADGAIADAIVWKVPKPVHLSGHKIKYRLYYGRSGKRLIGYDNERGKGDRKHVSDRQEVYDFVSIEQLMTDFIADVEALRGEADE